MAKQLRVGLIGLGGVGAIHLRTYLAEQRIELVAVVEPRSERFEELNIPAEILRFTDHREMLAVGAVDVACIATPVATHRAISVDCARAGVHVLCEKPLEVSSIAAQEMLSECERNAVKLGYASSYRYLPAVLAARELIQSGRLGEIHSISERAVGGAVRGGAEAMGFAHYPKGGPGGSGLGLVDHGIHFIDIFPWLLDSPICTVAGRGNVSGEPPASEWLTMEFASGAIGSLLYSESVYSATGPDSGLVAQGEGWDIDSGLVCAGEWSAAPGHIDICGTLGALKIYHYANRLYLNDAQGCRELTLQGAAPPAQFSKQMLAFLNALEQGQEPPVSGEKGLSALNWLLQIYDAR
ncbi:MAG: Gfo/Idh/MocA family oxidoreductase [Pseudomonadota bacterium]